jgi:hypothetical protein
MSARILTAVTAACFAFVLYGYRPRRSARSVR